MVLMVHQEVRVRTRTLQAGNKGFTLIELIIVFTLIVLFLSIVLINTGRIYDSLLLRESSFGVLKIINRARAISMTQRIPVRLRIDSDTNSYWIEPLSERFTDKNLTKRIILKEGLKIEGDDILFSPLGSNTGGIIKITDRKGRYYIVSIDSRNSKVKVEKH
jgi:general secretion pathway protein H